MTRLLLLVALAGCGDKDPAAADTDTGTPGTSADTGLCADAPVLTWANFGDGFVTEHCQACHASTSPDRRGAPEDVTFDTLDQTLAWRDRVLARSAGDDPTMPPQGGVDPVEREKVEIWLTCWE